MTHHETMRVIARITGRVQGVNFRATAGREARARGLTGRVRNEPDGSVSVDVEGAPAAIETFLAWCAIGPPAAKVERVETTAAAPLGYEEFRIARPDGF